jgi:DNA-binding Lrp family transcriptional regulator
MAYEEIDELDKEILYILQKNPRRVTCKDIAAQINCSSSNKVQNRIQHLEAEGIIRGYRAIVDYQKSGYPLRMLFYCTASISKRDDFISDILAVNGVVSVQELVSGEQNLLVTVVGESDSEITIVAQELLDMGLTIADEVLMRAHERAPFGELASDNRTVEKP